MNNIIFIDISQFIKLRYETGIQRVLKEFLLNAIKNNLNIKIIYYIESNYYLLITSELEDFLSNIKTYKINLNNKINLFQNNDKNKIFFELDSVWNESNNPRVELYKKLKQNNFKIINFIYDLIPIKFPHLMRKNTQKNFNPYISALNQFSDKIIFDSYSAKNDFQEFYPKNNTPKDVIYLGSNYTPKNKNLNLNFKFINQKYILFVGTLEPRKRQDLLLEAFNILHKKYKDLNLVFVGAIGWNTQSLAYRIQNHSSYNQNIFLLQNTNDDELYHLYQNSYLTAYLSDYEGYGLPIVESLYHNKPTITSNNSSLKEIGKNLVEYISNNNINELVIKLDHFLSNNQEYLNKISNIKNNYKKTTWTDFYNNIIKSFNI